ncbi:MAG: ureidoglycolate lyase [Thermosphaera sp.]
MIKELVVGELDNETFAPYGAVLDPERASPKMKEDIFTFWDNLAVMNVQGNLTVALLEVYSRAREFSKLERHVRTEEVFFALDGDVVVLVGTPTPPQAPPDPSTVRAFRLQAGQGVFLRAGTWHWIPWPWKPRSRLLVLFRQGTPDYDLEIRDLKKEQGLSFRISV